MPRRPLALTLGILLVLAACKAIDDTPRTGKKITKVRFAASERMPCMPCDMILTVDDTVSFHVRETTGLSQLAPDSSWVVFTSFGGAGGYRGSGQALWRYDIRKGEKTEIMREYYLVEQITPLPVKGGGPMLIVSMREPLTLIRHLAIVDPMRGEVFRAERSVVVGSDSAGVTIREWAPPASWLAEALDDSTGLPKAAPVRTWRLSPTELRQFAVLTNEERVWGQQLEFQATTDTFDTQGMAPAPSMPVAPEANQAPMQPGQRPAYPGQTMPMPRGGKAPTKIEQPPLGQGVKVPIP
ncbi:MAG: hypothetical protein HY275_02195 [Gemmatimonadetes bacterium]|nr:hypothetical protein [Gemmatimonadota bacterium]